MENFFTEMRKLHSINPVYTIKPTRFVYCPLDNFLHLVNVSGKAYSGSLGVLLEPTSGDCTGLSRMRSRGTEAAGDQSW